MPSEKDDLNTLIEMYEKLKAGNKPVTVDEDANVTLADIFDAPSSSAPAISTTPTIQIGVQHVNPGIGVFDMSSMSVPVMDENIQVRYSDSNYSYRTITLKEYVEMKVMAALREIVEGK